ncbi:MAG: substrate-binding domain-containing protein [Lachnospiraceae bacterium]|nr:substrate-binding domain-containing protein [Lachnospiraceae bacterium]
MGKIERALMYVLAAALAVSLVITFAWGLLERGEDVSSISVIVHDEDDAQWKKFKMGMDQAASEYNAEVNFVTLYDRNDVGQQMELIEREVSNGAQAIILSPAGDEELALALEKAPPSAPLILIGGGLESEIINREISADQEAMGYSLGMAMKEDGIENCVVYTGNGTQSFITDRLSGMRKAFREAGISYTVTGEQPETYFWRGIQAVVALDDTLTAELCADGMFWYYEKKVYGFGSSDQLLKYLDEGELELLMFVNSYDEGYLSLQAAVQEIQKEGKSQDEALEYYKIKRERIYQKNYQRLLFPSS